jgi:DNA polymerase-3 subunit delta'
VRVVEPGQINGGEEAVSEGTGGGDTITIGQIRALQHESSLSPFEGKKRVYVLSDFEKASTEAANCLLKTLEEPPANVVLVLTAQGLGSLLPTIVSRCQVLRLHRLPLADVQEALVERWKVEPEQAGMLAKLSMGRLGWAVQAFQDEQLFDQRRADLDELLDALGEDRLARMERALKLSRRRDALPEVLKQWFIWWRDVLLFQMNCSQLAINSDRKMALQAHAEAYESKSILKFLSQVRNTYRWLRQNANARLAMEALLLQLPEAT